jgi:hypothetical protein
MVGRGAAVAFRLAVVALCVREHRQALVALGRADGVAGFDEYLGRLQIPGLGGGEVTLRLGDRGELEQPSSAVGGRCGQRVQGRLDELGFMIEISPGAQLGADDPGQAVDLSDVTRVEKVLAGFEQVVNVGVPPLGPRGRSPLPVFGRSPVRVRQLGRPAHGGEKLM